MQTVETLLDAATQVLQKDGEDHFNTNRVAEVAGFSIGTLYQYFPNKEALVAALADRERGRIERAIARALAKADAPELEDVIRVVVRAGLTAFGRHQRTRKFVIVQMIRLKLGSAALKGIYTIGSTVVDAIVTHSRGRARPLSEAGAFVLTHALTGPIRMAVLEDSTLLDTPEFEDELVRLALRFLLP